MQPLKGDVTGGAGAARKQDQDTMSNPFADFHDVEELAKFCAELVRQGIMFHVMPQGSGYRVNLTGF